jgi:ketosteroid isomerase-like protein
MAGSGETFAAAKAEGQAQFSIVLDTLFKTFELIDYQIQGMTIDGSNATVHWRGNFRSGVNGETAETEIIDLIRIHDGRILSVIEFCDTALASRLMGI